MGFYTFAKPHDEIGWSEPMVQLSSQGEINQFIKQSGIHVIAVSEFHRDKTYLDDHPELKHSGYGPYPAVATIIFQTYHE